MGEVSKTLSYLRLFRLPNVFTALADVMMGYLFTSLEGPILWGPLLTLLGASALLYTSGMVLNDVFDIEQDRAERPHRPLPSGRISLTHARRLGWGMLVAGTLLAVVADVAWARGNAPFGAVSVVAILLAVCILIYDGVLKKTLLGPWFMGGCRAANVLLGMTGGAMAVPTLGSWWQVDRSGVMVATGLGLYVAGITWFARSEAKESARGFLIWGLVVMLLGFVTLGLFPETGEFAIGARKLQFPQEFVWPALVAMLVFTIVRRAVTAILQPTPARVQVTVKQCIFSIIVLDAAVCLAVRSPIGWAIAILALSVPMLGLGRWVYST